MAATPTSIPFRMHGAWAAIDGGFAHIEEQVKGIERGLQTAILGICELRNAHGFASHASGGPRPMMEDVQALFAATAADAIVGFLHRVHRQEQMVEVPPRSEFDDNHSLNAYIDEANDAVRIFDLEYRPSEVLFGVDRDAYRDVLSRFDRSEVDAPSGDPA